MTTQITKEDQAEFEFTLIKNNLSWTKDDSIILAIRYRIQQEFLENLKNKDEDEFTKSASEKIFEEFVKPLLDRDGK